MSAPHDVKVVVHYIASAKPFEHDFPPATTVGQVKEAALSHFHLTEGSNPDGNTVTYSLYLHNRRLDDLRQTIGELVEHGHVLQLKLAQQITQGAL